MRRSYTDMSDTPHFNWWFSQFASVCFVSSIIHDLFGGASFIIYSRQYSFVFTVLTIGPNVGTSPWSQVAPLASQSHYVPNWTHQFSSQTYCNISIPSISWWHYYFVSPQDWNQDPTLLFSLSSTWRCL